MCDFSWYTDHRFRNFLWSDYCIATSVEVQQYSWRRYCLPKSELHVDLCCSINTAVYAVLRLSPGSWVGLQVRRHLRLVFTSSSVCQVCNKSWICWILKFSWCEDCLSLEVETLQTDSRFRFWLQNKTKQPQICHLTTTRKKRKTSHDVFTGDYSKNEHNKHWCVLWNNNNLNK